MGEVQEVRRARGSQGTTEMMTTRLILWWLCSALSGIVAGMWLSQWKNGINEIGLIMAIPFFVFSWWFCYRAMSHAR